MYIATTLSPTSHYNEQDGAFYRLEIITISKEVSNGQESLTYLSSNSYSQNTALLNANKYFDILKNRNNVKASKKKWS